MAAPRLQECHMTAPTSILSPRPGGQSQIFNVRPLTSYYRLRQGARKKFGLGTRPIMVLMLSKIPWKLACYAF